MIYQEIEEPPSRAAAWLNYAALLLTMVVAAGILTARPQERPPAGHKSRLPPCRVEHAAKLWIGPVTSGANDDRLAGPDVYRLC